MLESDAANEFRYQVIRKGCSDLAYSPIFGGGFNATTLHYVRNNEQLKAGDLLLVDAAGECGGYRADLTQTFPVSPRFSAPQKKIYQAVLQVNREILQNAAPGITYRALHALAVERLTDHLLSLGVLKGELESNIRTSAYRPYFPHALGHYLGLDVHDAGVYQERGMDFELKAGMVLAIEPGLYFREPGNPFHGVGIRIEDDVLITETGAEVLTGALPREVDEIESLRAEAHG
jgi:Xaa-Pro aminopeptidase